MRAKTSKWIDKRLLLYFIILIAFAILMRSFVFETYLVSQHSMSNTLLDGDKVLVKKWARGDVKRNDIVVFQMGSEAFIKRCIARPGDTLAIRKGKVFVNGLAANLPEAALNKEVSYFDLADPVQLGNGRKFDLMIYETYGHFWSLIDFGPLVIPKKGMQVSLNRENRNLYKKILLAENSTVAADTNRADAFSGSYAFRNDYYFMMGDNRLASRDSRTFGPIPGDEIVGTTSLVLYSKKSFFHSGRLFKKVD